MMNSTTGTRSIETSIDIDAPVDAVWEAISTAEGLMNWFPPIARVEPGVGGKIWTSWGGEFEGSVTIDVWEPNRRLRYSHPAARGNIGTDRGAEAELPEPIAEDFILEGKGGKTTLRLVHSGFSRGSAWDTLYDGTVRGWAFELRGLRHYLHHHPGERRTVAHAQCALPVSFAEGWALLMGPEGLLAEGSVDRLTEGDAYHVRASTGDVLDGMVAYHNPPQDFCASVANVDDSFLRVKLDNAYAPGASETAHLWLSVYGDASKAAPAWEKRMQAMLNRLFGGGASRDQAS